MMTFLLKIGGITYSQLGRTVGIVSLAIAAAVIGLKTRPRLWNKLSTHDFPIAFVFWILSLTLKNLVELINKTSLETD